MKGGVLIYKCRSCRKLNKSTHVPNGLEALVSIRCYGRSPVEWGAMIACMTDICNCTDGNLGISDLIGFEEDKNSN